MALYTTDGRIGIDNNPAERSLRGIAITRKNFLFLGSEAGGERAAVLYTVLETAKLNGLNPKPISPMSSTAWPRGIRSTASASCCLELEPERSSTQRIGERGRMADAYAIRALSAGAPAWAKWLVPLVKAPGTMMVVSMPHRASSVE